MIIVRRMLISIFFKLECESESNKGSAVLVILAAPKSPIRRFLAKTAEGVHLVF